MGKTHRYSPDEDDYVHYESPRISRGDIQRANRQVAHHSLALIVSPPDNYVELPDFDGVAEHFLDRKLDLIQAYGEQIIEAGLTTG